MLQTLDLIMENKFTWNNLLNGFSNKRHAETKLNKVLFTMMSKTLRYF